MPHHGRSPHAAPRPGGDHAWLRPERVSRYRLADRFRSVFINCQLFGLCAAWLSEPVHLRGRPSPRTLLRVSELRVPMAEELVWANVVRPQVPMCYLDLNHIINMAKSLSDPTKAPAGSRDLYDSAKRAADEHRVVFPISATHFREVAKIADHRRRVALTDVFEQLSGFKYLLGRTQIARLELDAGIRALLGEPTGDPVPLIRPTVGQAFGIAGTLKVGDVSGADRSAAVRALLGDDTYDELDGADEPRARTASASRPGRRRASRLDEGSALRPRRDRARDAEPA